MNEPVPQDLLQLCAQVQLERAQTLDAEALSRFAEAVARATAGVRGFEASRNNDEGEVLNLVFALETLPSTWPKLKQSILESNEFGNALKTSSIWICTGKDGWNDYLLLSHFDPDAELDAVS